MQELYRVWLEKVSSMDLTNAKSIYQVLSEVIPILLTLKDIQDTYSESLDLTKAEIEEKINEKNIILNNLLQNLSPEFLEFNNEFIEKISIYRQELTNNINSYSEEIETKLSNFINSFNQSMQEFANNYSNDYDNFSEEFNTILSTKVQDILTNLTNLSDEIISVMQDFEDNFDHDKEFFTNDITAHLDRILSLINVSEIIEQLNYDEIINKFDNKYLSIIKNANKNIYVVLNYMQNENPDNANENELFYNTLEKKLYKYNNNEWKEDTIKLNTIYKFNNTLYYSDIELDTVQINIMTEGSALRSLYPNTSYLQILGMVDNKVFVAGYKENYGNANRLGYIDLDEPSISNVHLSDILATSLSVSDSLYASVIKYNDNGVEKFLLDRKISTYPRMVSTDGINFTPITLPSSVTGYTLNYLNGTFYFLNGGRTMITSTDLISFSDPINIEIPINNEYKFKVNTYTSYNFLDLYKNGVNLGSISARNNQYLLQKMIFTDKYLNVGGSTDNAGIIGADGKLKNLNVDVDPRKGIAYKDYQITCYSGSYPAFATYMPNYINKKISNEYKTQFNLGGNAVYDCVMHGKMDNIDTTFIRVLRNTDNRYGKLYKLNDISIVLKEVQNG